MPNMMSQMTLEMKPGGILFFGSVFWPLKKPTDWADRSTVSKGQTFYITPDLYLRVFVVIIQFQL